MRPPPPTVRRLSQPKLAARAAAVLREAMEAHQEGDNDAARRLYKAVLAADAKQPDAWHLLGVLEAQCGHSRAGAELIQHALTLRPQEAMFHNNIGNVLVDMGMTEAAEKAYATAAELDVKRIDARNNLGVLRGRRGQFLQAETLLQDVIRDAPEFAVARQNLANLYLNAGRAEEAVAHCEAVLASEPADSDARLALGRAYSAMGLLEKLEGVYHDWLRVEPGNPIALHNLRASTGRDVPERAPDAYVVNLFDNFSRSFDATLARLGYSAPQQVADVLQRCAAAPAGQYTIVDAGCGTGLLGPLVKPWAQRLVGVDLSSGMLRKAAGRQLYDALVEAELVGWLQGQPQSCDFVLCADTLIYFGVLEPFALAARQALRPGGALICTLESHPDDDPANYRLHSHGRYSHRRQYVDAALRSAGLARVDIEPHVPRTESGVPVPGWLVIARAG